MSIFQTINQTVSINDLAERLGLKPDGAMQANGQRMFHGPAGKGDTPSLSLNEQHGKFHDWADENKRGDQIELVMHVQCVNKGEAIKWICQEYGIENQPQKDYKTQQNQPKTQAQHLAQQCQKEALDTRLKDYLTSRGVTEPAIDHAITKGTLGFNDYTNPSKQPSEKGYQGAAVAFIIKSLNPNIVAAVEKRYINEKLNGGQKMRDTGTIAGNVWTSDYQRLKTAKNVYIVESPINVLSIDSCHIKHTAAIATLGKTNIKKTDWRFLRGKNVYLAFDKDEQKSDGSLPGQQTAWAMYDTLSNLNIKALILDQKDWTKTPKTTQILEEQTDSEKKPEYDIDINDMLKVHGVTTLKKQLKKTEQWLIQGVSGNLQEPKNRVWLPNIDTKDYWRYRTTPESTLYIRTTKEKDPSGDLIEKEVEVHVAGFRIVNLQEISIASDSSAATGSQDDSPRKFYVAKAQTRMEQDKLINKVFVDGLHNPANWENTFGAINDPKLFKRAITILENTVSLNRIQAANIVGLAWLNKKLTVNEGPDCYFANPVQQCAAYNNLIFHNGNQSDTTQILKAYRETFRNHAALIMLVWSLSTHLKLFSGVFPHLVIGAGKSTGKTALIEKIGITAVLNKYTAEDLNPYRLKVLSSGTSFPIVFDEFSNAPMSKRLILSGTMQNTYSYATVTSGSQAISFLKFAPLMLGGEDIGDTDNVLTKTVRCTLDIKYRGEEINAHNLPKWPMKQWLKFLADIPRQQFDEQFEIAHQHCQNYATTKDQTSKRMVKNYALLLLGWRYVATFSDIQHDTQTAVDVENSIIREMNIHIQTTDAQREPWVSVIEKICMEITTDAYEYPYKVQRTRDIDDEEHEVICLNATHIMDHIMTKPYLRDFKEKLPISSRNALIAQLKSKDIIVKKFSPSIKWKGTATRFQNMLALSVEKLKAYGVSVPGAEYESNINAESENHDVEWS